MKKAFYLSIAVLVFCQITNAQQTGSVLFSIPGNMAFTMVLQGQKPVNSQPARNLFISKIPSGIQTADFTVLRPGLADMKFNYAFSVEAGKEGQFYVQGQGNSFALLLSDYLPENPSGHSDIMSFECRPVASKIPNSFIIQPASNAFNPLADTWSSAKGWASMTSPAVTVTTPVNAPAQVLGSPCFPALANDAFTTSFNRVKNKSGESAKVAIAKDILEQGCFSSDQILQFMNQAQYETNRIELGKTGWQHCSDPANWSIVYDAFDYGENIETLKAFVKANPYSNLRNGSVQVNNPVNPSPQPQNPVVEKPVPVLPPAPPRVYLPAVPGYNGAVGCEWPTDDATFQVQKESIRSKSFSSTQLTVMKQIVPKNCLTVSQVKDLMSVFSFESDKMEVAKFCWNYVYDINNYFLVNDAFGFSSSIDELDTYLKANPRKGVGMIGGYLGGGNPATNPAQRPQMGGATIAAAITPMDDASFNTLSASIRKQLSARDQVSVMKQGLEGKFLTTAQVKSLMGLFYGQYEKLEAAKIGWLKCTDPANFFTVNDLLFSSSSIRTLDEFRKANPK